jgi:hypothetical protein
MRHHGGRQLAADVLGIDYRATNAGRSDSQPEQAQMEAERQQREQERQRQAEEADQRRVFVGMANCPAATWVKANT